MLGVANPFSSWTRSPASIPECGRGRRRRPEVRLVSSMTRTACGAPQPKGGLPASTSSALRGTGRAQGHNRRRRISHAVRRHRIRRPRQRSLRPPRQVQDHSPTAQRASRPRLRWSSIGSCDVELPGRCRLRGSRSAARSGRMGSRASRICPDVRDRGILKRRQRSILGRACTTGCRESCASHRGGNGCAHALDRLARQARRVVESRNDAHLPVLLM